MASGAAGRAEARESAAPEAEAGPFVLNLCSSTTPMALAQVELPELKRFTFFVSRRFEEGRERFRLHMGYFTTLAEAEEWLNVVREIYPGAWAGEAPGKKLRARAAAAAAAQAQHALGPQPGSSLPNLPPVAAAPQATAVPSRPTPASHPTVATPARPPVAPAAPIARPVELKPTAARAPTPSLDVPGMAVPTVHAATALSVPTAPARAASLSPPVAKAAPVQVLAPVAKAAPQVVPPAAKPAHAPVVAAPVARAPQVSAPQQQTRSAPQRPNAPTPARPPVKSGAESPVALSKARPRASTKGTAFADSNVREVLAALGDDAAETGQTRMMPAPQLPRAEEESSLTDTQVLRYLETRRSEDGLGRADDPHDAGISLLKPDDTGTRRALKEAVSQNAAVSFAVQLQWSVQPVELDKVPPLAIFSAYTLYTVEGSREGRKWYGLRLGFFSDAISAKQVAYYVRSEFSSVAVVPVSPQEKQRASDEDKKANAALAFPRKLRSTPVDEFKLIDSDEHEKPTQAAPKPVAPPPAPAKAAVPVAKAPGKRASPAKGGRVNARERKGPQTLEETLEILGAGELEIDGGRGEIVNDTGVRHLRVEVQKNTPFSRLLERLSERTKKN
jgi:hypothetical protein